MPTKTTAKKPAKRPIKVQRKLVKVAPKRTKKVPQQKAPTVVPLPPLPSSPVQVLAPVPVKTDAERIWEEIKDLPIQMFGLPGQLVSMHCTPVPIEPTRLYVTIRSSATLPSLEAAVAGRFNVEQADKWVIVTRVPPPLVPAKR